MTTREYQEAYDDDADQVRSWAAQDAQERPSDLERIVAQRNVALAAIARVEALATQWEQPGPPWRLPLLECAAQLFQAIDEVALEYPRGPVG